ncbi:MAG: cache domain-containing protein [Stellaceae bacterium]
MTVTDPQRHRRRASAKRGSIRKEIRWPTYAGITALLMFIIVALAGGIIWYNSTKSNELAIASAKRLMKYADEKIVDRIRLLYDPMYAVVGIASAAPMFTAPDLANNPSTKATMLRALRTYPQILSLYVGFDSGDFFMTTHMAGAKADTLRKELQAPPEAVFANEIVTANATGPPDVRWVFLADDGAVVGRRDQGKAYDPRKRPWFAAAKATDVVEHSDLYVFASNGEPGFTLSRSFGGPTPGVMGADLAVVDLANFLSEQKITSTSQAFIFTKAGEVVAIPDGSRIDDALKATGRTGAALPKIADLNDPVISGLVAAYRDQPMSGTRIYKVAGRSYIGRVVNIPARYGNDQVLAIVVPVDEIEKPFAEIRNETLLYSIAFLVFALPLFVTLVVVMIDRKLERPAPWARFSDDE